MYIQNSFVCIFRYTHICDICVYIYVTICVHTHIMCRNIYVYTDAKVKKVEH